MRPTDDQDTPCSTDYATFLSTDVADHRLAKELCGDCPFTDWCVSEREQAASINGRTSIEGTWHGLLWVDGVVSPKGLRSAWTRKVSA